MRLGLGLGKWVKPFTYNNGIVFAGSSATIEAERRTKIRNDPNCRCIYMYSGPHTLIFSLYSGFLFLYLDVFICIR